MSLLDNMAAGDNSATTEKVFIEIAELLNHHQNERRLPKSNPYCLGLVTSQLANLQKVVL